MPDENNTVPNDGEITTLAPENTPSTPEENENNVEMSEAEKEYREESVPDDLDQAIISEQIKGINWSVGKLFDSNFMVDPEFLPDDPERAKEITKKTEKKQQDYLKMLNGTIQGAKNWAKNLNFENNRDQAILEAKEKLSQNPEVEELLLSLYKQEIQETLLIVRKYLDEAEGPTTDTFAVLSSLIHGKVNPREISQQDIENIPIEYPDDFDFASGSKAEDPAWRNDLARETAKRLQQMDMSDEEVQNEVNNALMTKYGVGASTAVHENIRRALYDGDIKIPENDPQFRRNIKEEKIKTWIQNNSDYKIGRGDEDLAQETAHALNNVHELGPAKLDQFIIQFQDETGEFLPENQIRERVAILQAKRSEAQEALIEALDKTIPQSMSGEPPWERDEIELELESEALIQQAIANGDILELTHYYTEERRFRRTPRLRKTQHFVAAQQAWAGVPTSKFIDGARREVIEYKKVRVFNMQLHHFRKAMAETGVARGYNPWINKVEYTMSCNSIEELEDMKTTFENAYIRFSGSGNTISAKEYYSRRDSGEFDNWGTPNRVLLPIKNDDGKIPEIDMNTFQTALYKLHDSIDTFHKAGLYDTRTPEEKEKGVEFSKGSIDMVDVIRQKIALRNAYETAIAKDPNSPEAQRLKEALERVENIYTGFSENYKRGAEYRAIAEIRARLLNTETDADGNTTLRHEEGSEEWFELLQEQLKEVNSEMNNLGLILKQIATEVLSKANNLANLEDPSEYTEMLKRLDEEIYGRLVATILGMEGSQEVPSHLLEEYKGLIKALTNPYLSRIPKGSLETEDIEKPIIEVIEPQEKEKFNGARFLAEQEGLILEAQEKEEDDPTLASTMIFKTFDELVEKGAIYANDMYKMNWQINQVLDIFENQGINVNPAIRNQLFKRYGGNIIDAEFVEVGEEKPVPLLTATTEGPYPKTEDQPIQGPLSEYEAIIASEVPDDFEEALKARVTSLGYEDWETFLKESQGEKRTLDTWKYAFTRALEQNPDQTINIENVLKEFPNETISAVLPEVQKLVRESENNKIFTTDERFAEIYENLPEDIKNLVKEDDVRWLFNNSNGGASPEENSKVEQISSLAEPTEQIQDGETMEYSEELSQKVSNAVADLDVSNEAAPIIKSIVERMPAGSTELDIIGAVNEALNTDADKILAEIPENDRASMIGDIRRVISTAFAE